MTNMQQILSNTPFTISIGLYKINISCFYNNKAAYVLPDDIALFQDDSAEENTDWNIDYSILPQQKFIEPETLPMMSYEEGPMPYRIYKVDSESYLWIRKDKDKKNCLVYRISRNWSLWELIFDRTKGYSFNYIDELAYIFPYSILDKGGIMFHGVVMEWQALGIIVCAHSGVGKTTHTKLWKDHQNAFILNGDRALCCREEGTWFTYGAPWNGSSRECLNRKTILSAVVILEQAEVNQVIRLTPLRGACELISLTFAPAWEPVLMNCSLDLIDEIACNIPILKLKCTPDIEAVAVLKSELEKLILHQ